MKALASANKAQQGIALILVLMLCAVIAVVVTVYQYKTRSHLALASQAKNLLLAKAKVETAKAELSYLLLTSPLWLERPGQDVNQRLGLPLKFNFWGEQFQWQDVDIRLFDTAGLLAVHPFNAAAWFNVLDNAGAAEPGHIVAALEDWFDADDFLHLNGAEKSDYLQPGLPRNGLPQTVEELQLVKGMHPYWPKIAPYVTFVGSSVVNFDFSPEAILPSFIGEYRATQLAALRRGDEVSADQLTPERSEEMNVYLSRRLRVSIYAEIEDSAYGETFILGKGYGSGNIMYIAEKQPGFVMMEAN